MLNEVPPVEEDFSVHQGNWARAEHPARLRYSVKLIACYFSLFMEHAIIYPSTYLRIQPTVAPANPSVYRSIHLLKIMLINNSLIHEIREASVPINSVCLQSCIYNPAASKPSTDSSIWFILRFSFI